MAKNQPTWELHAEHRNNTDYTIAYAEVGIRGTLEDTYGTVQLEICDECHYIETQCEHKKNVWNEDCTKLTCDLCGLDGT